VAVKIRLKRLGKIRAPYYRIVVADSRTKRDGRVIEEIGKYHPTENPSLIEVDSERAQYWLGVGAQPTEQVAALLKLTGDWGIFKGDKNAKSTVKLKEAKPEFVADEKKKPVLKPKAEEPDSKAGKKAEKPAKSEDAAAAEAAPAADETAAAATGDDEAAEKSAESGTAEANTGETGNAPAEQDAAAADEAAADAAAAPTTEQETPEQADNSDADAVAETDKA